MKASDCILFSGGAPGAEAEFGACAERHGVEEVNFTFEGHKIVRHRGVRVLNHEELQNGDVSLEYVSRLMHRRYTDAPTIRKVLQTMWYQVNSGQEIWVVGTILEDKTVRGRHRVGSGVRQALQQEATRLRSGEGALVLVERRRLAGARPQRGTANHAPALYRHWNTRPAGASETGHRGLVLAIIRSSVTIRYNKPPESTPKHGTRPAVVTAL